MLVGYWGGTSCWGYPPAQGMVEFQGVGESCAAPTEPPIAPTGATITAGDFSNRLTDALVPISPSEDSDCDGQGINLPLNEEFPLGVDTRISQPHSHQGLQRQSRGMYAC